MLSRSRLIIPTATTIVEESFILFEKKKKLISQVPLTIITKCSILDVAAVLDPPLNIPILSYYYLFFGGEKLITTFSIDYDDNYED